SVLPRNLANIGNNADLILTSLLWLATLIREPNEQAQVMTGVFLVKSGFNFDRMLDQDPAGNIGRDVSCK
ncbi:MAG: hypothetical protein WBN40_00385, partial [Pseudomonadales bacterium]